MKVPFSEKLIAYLTLLSGLSISAVAVYYSVIGLTSIFSAAVIPVIIMGITLELSKLIATLWLKQNWKIAPNIIKSYLIISILVLMFITSMGIFGFLSKSHNDQLLVTGNNSIQIQEIDRLIEVEKRNIKDATLMISQLDQAVQALIDSNRIRGNTGSIAVRKNQSQERENLNKIILESTNKINQLETQKLPLEKQRLSIEAEVGPIKYIAAFIYGNTPDKNILEKAVTWVIIIIVCVFDPLAVVLLLASQISFQNFRERKLINFETKIKQDPPLDDNKENKKLNDDFKENSLKNDDNIQKDDLTAHHHPSTHPYLNQGFGSKPPEWKSEKPLVFNEIVKKEIVTSKPQEVVNVPPKPIKQREESKIVRTKIFPRNQNLQEPLFVQNEEQIESNLWSSTSTNNLFLDNESKKLMKEKFEQKINHYVDLVKSARISMSDVPEDILSIVKSRV